MMGHCGKAKEHVDSHTSGRWEPVKINFRLKILCCFSVKKEKKKTHLEQYAILYMPSELRQQQLSKSWYHTLKPIT